MDLALPTSFGGLHDGLTNETCRLIVILSHRLPILVNRAEILVNFLSFGRERRRISGFGVSDSSLVTKPPHQILFFTTSPNLLMSTLLRLVLSVTEVMTSNKSRFLMARLHIPHLWVRTRHMERRGSAPTKGRRRKGGADYPVSFLMVATWIPYPPRNGHFASNTKFAPDEAALPVQSDANVRK